MKKTLFLVGLMVSALCFGAMAQEPTRKKGRDNMPAEQKQKWEERHNNGEHHGHGRGHEGKPEMKTDSTNAKQSAVGNSKSNGVPKTGSKTKTRTRGQQ